MRIFLSALISLFAISNYSHAEFEFKCKGSSAAVAVGGSMIATIGSTAIMSMKSPWKNNLQNPTGATADQPTTMTKLSQYHSYKEASASLEDSRNWLAGSAAVVGVLAGVDFALGYASFWTDKAGSVKCFVSAGILGVLASVQVGELAASDGKSKEMKAEAQKLVDSCRSQLSACGAGTKAGDDCKQDDLLQCTDVIRESDAGTAAGKLADAGIQKAVNSGVAQAFGAPAGVVTDATIQSYCDTNKIAADQCKGLKDAVKTISNGNTTTSAQKLAKDLADKLNNIPGDFKMPKEVLAAMSNPTQGNLQNAAKVLGNATNLPAGLLSPEMQAQLKNADLKGLASTGNSSSEMAASGGGAKKAKSETFNPFEGGGGVASSSGGGDTLSLEKNDAFSSSKLSTLGDISSDINGSIFKMISSKYSQKYSELR